MIEILPVVATFLAAFLFMELVAWFTHKYIMHGALWKLHEDHHVPHDHTLEKNDLFALMFAIPSVLLLAFGTMNGNSLLISAGTGILVYGMAYFFVHDIYVHRRVKWFRNVDNSYLRSVRIAHKMHHKHRVKEPGESFGFLWVGKKYREIAKRNRS
ncbi:MAG: hypothetical protein WDZ29_04650 [Balneolaceae bacterium]